MKGGSQSSNNSSNNSCSISFSNALTGETTVPGAGAQITAKAAAFRAASQFVPLSPPSCSAGLGDHLGRRFSFAAAPSERPCAKEPGFGRRKTRT